MGDKNIEIFALIEQRKLELEKQLAEQIEVREAANKRIAEIRAEIEDLPVRRTRRPRKQAEEKGDE